MKTTQNCGIGARSFLEKLFSVLI